MKEKDNIRELFSEKLGNYEAKVDPQLWTKISSQLPAATPVSGAGGLSLFAKSVVGIIATAAVVTTVVVLVNTNDQKDKKHTKVPVVVQQSEEKAVREQTPVVINDHETPESNNPDLNPANRDVEVQDNVTSLDEGAENRIEPQEKDVITENSKTVGTDTRESPLEANDSGTTAVDPVAEKDNVDSSEKVPEAQEERENDTPAELTAMEFRLPNGFTPNNDGQNDYLELGDLNDLEGIKEFSIVVLNERNQIVYTSNVPNFKWDGTGIDGSPVENGNYLYYITAIDKNGNPVKGAQRLTITR